MSQYKQEVQRLRDYLTKQLETPDSEDCSVEELFELWRHENPTKSLMEQNVCAIQEAIDALPNDPGITIEELDRQMKEKYPALRNL